MRALSRNVIFIKLSWSRTGSMIFQDMWSEELQASITGVPTGRGGCLEICQAWVEFDSRTLGMNETQKLICGSWAVYSSGDMSVCMRLYIVKMRAVQNKFPRNAWTSTVSTTAPFTGQHHAAHGNRQSYRELSIVTLHMWVSSLYKD